MLAGWQLTSAGGRPEECGVGAPVGWLDVDEGCLEVAAGCLEVAAGCLEVAGRCLEVAGRCLEVAGRCLQVAGRCLQVAGRCLQVAGRCLVGLGGSVQYADCAEGGQDWGPVHPVVSVGASDGRQKGHRQRQASAFFVPSPNVWPMSHKNMC